jgi:phosphate-selective porin OprO/OprP
LKKQLGISPKSAPTFVTAQGKETKLSFGGFVQGQAEFGKASDSRTVAGDRFYLRRARLGVKGSFAEHFDFTLQADLGSNSLGNVTGNRAQATDAFVVWNQYEQATLTFGQFKTPYGNEQLMSDTKIATIERSLPSDSLTLSRQLGAMVSGSVAGKKFSYAAGLFNGSGVNTSTNDNDNFLYVGRVNGLAFSGKTVKVTAGAGVFASHDTGTFTGRRSGAQLDAQIVAGRGEIDAEYFQTHFDRVTGADTDARGWAILGAWFIVPGKVQAVGRYETYDPNTDAANDDANLWTIGVNYLLKGDDLKFGVNYLIGDPAGALKNQGRLITRIQLVF